VPDEDIVDSLCAGIANFTYGVHGHSHNKILGKPRPYLRDSHAGGRQVHAMRACGQRDIGSPVYQDFALRCAREGDDTASQFIQGTVRLILLANLYEIDAPIKGSLDARNKGNSG
jgi:hypothetical protein